MTRKDYIAIAEALRQAFKNAEYHDEALTLSQKQHIIGYIALAMHRDNPNFDSKLFASSANPMFEQI
jgi:hypothetical protein